MNWLRQLLDKMYDTACRKNHDYAYGAGWSGNFDKYGLFGMMARWHDKIQRAENLLLRGAKAQVDEAVEDTLMDLATYSLLILQAYKEGMPLYGAFGGLIVNHQRDDNHEERDDEHDPDVVTHESRPPWTGSLSDHHQAPGNPLD